MVNLGPKRNARYTSAIPLPTLPYWFFLPLPSESVQTVGARSYEVVITKFSGIHGFRIFFSAARAVPPLSRIIILEEMNFITSLLLIDWNCYEIRQTLLLYVFVDLKEHEVQYSFLAFWSYWLIKMSQFVNRKRSIVHLLGASNRNCSNVVFIFDVSAVC